MSAIIAGGGAIPRHSKNLTYDSGNSTQPINAEGGAMIKRSKKRRWGYLRRMKEIDVLFCWYEKSIKKYGSILEMHKDSSLSIKIVFASYMRINIYEWMNESIEDFFL